MKNGDIIVIEDTSDYALGVYYKMINSKKPIDVIELLDPNIDIDGWGRTSYGKDRSTLEGEFDYNYLMSLPSLYSNKWWGLYDNIKIIGIVDITKFNLDHLRKIFNSNDEQGKEFIIEAIKQSNNGDI